MELHVMAKDFYPPAYMLCLTQLRYWSYCCSEEVGGRHASPLFFVPQPTNEKRNYFYMSVIAEETKLLHLQFKTRLKFATLAKRLVFKNVTSLIGEKLL